MLDAEGSARLDAAASPTELRLRADSDDLTVLAARYLSGPLGLAGLGDLRATGALSLEYHGDASGPRRLRVVPDRVDLVDPGGRFGLHGLDGELSWTAGTIAATSALSWRSAAVHGLALGPASLVLESRDGVLWLSEPVATTLLSGLLRLEQLRLAPGEGDSDIALGLSLIDLDLAALSRTLGWPSFSGSLSGRLPSARYRDGRLVFEGGLSMRVFDGSVAIERLEMERPFGVAPSLAADIVFADLDLEPLTAAFGFGSIEGRLMGAIRRLRLLDWTPVAFEAELLSDPDYRGRKRISQRAVRDISNLGGSGFVAGLQGQALRMFSTFGYSRLGIRCRLANDVCIMDGVGSAGDGYTLVRGAGLPRIDVVGFQRRVDWPVLMDRLRAATEGQLPLIE